MKSFIQWAEDKQLELPIIVDQEKGNKKTIDEKNSPRRIRSLGVPRPLCSDALPGWLFYAACC
jgi:hypothetical protein